MPDNTVTGTESLRCKIVIQDQTNTGALKADVKNNTLTNAIVGLVNLRESGETVSPVLDSNTFGDGSFYVEAVEPGTIDFYTSYQVPENSQGYWKLTGVDDLDVDWGKNPDGSTAYATEKIIEANRTGSHTLNFTGIDENNLIKTFTWFKDAIYWVTPDENPNPRYSGYRVDDLKIKGGHPACPHRGKIPLQCDTFSSGGRRKACL